MTRIPCLQQSGEEKRLMDSLTERMKAVAAEPVVMALGGIVTGVSRLLDARPERETRAVAQKILRLAIDERARLSEQRLGLRGGGEEPKGLPDGFGIILGQSGVPEGKEKAAQGA
jgi:hypothetical protein